MTKQSTAGRILSPYGSARDLPSFQELSTQLRDMKLLTRVVARSERATIAALERQVDGLASLVDRFYAVLGPRHWIFHASLPTDEISALLDTPANTDAIEERLIALYRDEERLTSFVRMVRHRDGFSQRDHQIARALAHYQAEEFASCVLHLIPVMDGFVNDFQPELRKGLASRDPDDMVAWDSIVGHHLGLSHALKTVHNTFKKRVDDEVFELYRHGIVHGTVVNFDNVYVATKAWNMLFAVGDWARATDEAGRPKEGPPSLRDTARRLWRDAKDRSYRDRFQPSSVDASDPGFDDLEVVRRARLFLRAWEKGQWAIVAQVFPPKLFGHSRTEGMRAERVKAIYDFHHLADFEITGVEFPQASAAVVRGFGTIGERSGPLKLRWLHFRPDETLATADDPQATWCIGVYAPQAFLDDSSAE